MLIWFLGGLLLGILFSKPKGKTLFYIGSDKKEYDNAHIAILLAPRNDKEELSKLLKKIYKK